MDGMMLPRTKYPLSPEAKHVAKELVAAWNEGRVDQIFTIAEMHGGGKVTRSTLFSEYTDSSLSAPRRSLLQELAQYKLITLTIKGIDERLGIPTRWEVLLLQELRNAVTNDFTVSDYFITLNAVGSVIYGDLNLAGGANYQSAATNVGDINLSIETLADELINMLGEQLLQGEVQLAEALQDLREVSNDPPPTRLNKLGKVMQQLGNCLQHTANTTVVISAIGYLAQILYALPK